MNAKFTGGKIISPPITAISYKNTLVLLVVRVFQIIQQLIESIVRYSVIKGGTSMDKFEFYEAVTSYKASMKQAQIMLERGLISADDYAKIDTKLAQKYGLNSCSVYAYNNLIYSENRGNIHTEEVFITNESN